VGSLWGQPRLGLQADVASGGGPGGTLKDFYPLFPKYAYFTEAQINAPINMVDVFPSVTIQPRRDFAVTAGVDFLWRLRILSGLRRILSGPRGLRRLKEYGRPINKG
jgi:hypothetical protein